MQDDVDLWFNLRLFDPVPEGCKLAKKDVCFVNIIGDDDTETAVKDIEEILKVMKKQENLSWGNQFKQAIMLHP